MSKFKLREPRNDEEEKLKEEFNVLFLENEEGDCWYEIAKKYDNVYWKVATDDDGRVLSADKDATKLWPIDMHVHEVSAPAEFCVEERTKWKVQGKVLVPYEKTPEEVAAETTKIKARIIASVSREIETLNDAAEFGDISKDESLRLIKLKKYRLAVSRVDLENPVWPEEV